MCVKWFIPSEKHDYQTGDGEAYGEERDYFDYTLSNERDRSRREGAVLPAPERKNKKRKEKNEELSAVCGPQGVYEASRLDMGTSSGVEGHLRRKEGRSL
jgi:hypothetical protein